jgi:hypothetical protein
MIKAAASPGPAQWGGLDYTTAPAKDPGTMGPQREIQGDFGGISPKTVELGLGMIL